MDMIKIGKFIANERKEKGYTQKELAFKLNISDKTVSKWERGNGFPDVSILLSLCNELNITVNELLCGERVSNDNYINKAEENMVNLIKIEKDNKLKMIISLFIIIFSLLSSLPLILIAGLITLSIWLRILLIIIGIFIMIGGIVIAIILDIDSGAYICPNCKHKFVPTMKSYIKGVHTLTKRKLKCPNCNELHYCKKVLKTSEK